MSIFRVSADQNGATSDGSPFSAPDPHFAPTPDYGTLGPDSDFAKNIGKLPASSSTSAPANKSAASTAAAKARVLSALATGIGILAALVGAVVGGPHGFIHKILGSTSTQQGGREAGNISARDLNRENAQEQAETLLTRAVSHSAGATDEIQSRIDSWRGQLSLDPQLSQLTTAALNSDAPSVRASGVEVQLAAYGLDKHVTTVDRLLHQADSDPLADVAEHGVAFPRSNLSYEDFVDWKRLNKVFTSLDAYGGGYLFSTPSGVEPVSAARVTDGFFRTLGIRPILGRDFYTGEDRPNAPRPSCSPMGHGSGASAAARTRSAKP